MPKDEQKEQANKKQEEERQSDLLKDPLCPGGCNQRLLSQGCACPKKKGGGNSGGSGDDGDKSEEKEGKEVANSFDQKKTESKELAYLTQAGKENTSWSQSPVLGRNEKFEFKNVKALLSIDLDFQNSNLTFKTDKVLSREDHSILEKYISDVKGILNTFCKERGLTSGKDYQIEEKTDMDDNYSLTISFSDKENFNAFVNHLFHEKMLPVPSNNLANVLKPSPDGNKNKDEEEQESLEKPKAHRSSPFSLPNPFDIDSGPKME